MRLENFENCEKIGNGSTATVYYDRNMGKCLKIFHSKVMAKDMEKKIKFMIGVEQLKNSTNLSWPEECVYDTKGEFVGYIMKRSPQGEPLSRFFNARLYQMDTHCITKFAYDFMTLIHNIHDAGMLIVDFNPNNFIITPDGEIFLVDTDNFQFRTKGGEQFKPEVACPFYLNKDLQKTISEELKTKRGMSEVIKGLPYGTFNHKTELFSMAVIVFQLFMNGCHPYSGRYNDEDSSITVNIYHDYSPYFGKGNPSDLGFDKPDMQILSRSLTQTFYNIFFTEVSPDVAENQLLKEIVEYDKLLSVRCTKEPKHYYLKGFTKCPWCELNRIKDYAIIDEQKENNEKRKSQSMNVGLVGNVKTTKWTVGSGNNINSQYNSAMVPVTPLVNVSGKGVRNNSIRGNVTKTSSMYGNNRNVHANISNNGNKKWNHQNQNNKGALLWIVFVAVCACQIYAFGAGYVGKFYASNVGESGNLIVLGGMAKYLLLIAGIIISVGVTVAFSHCSFTVGPAVLLDVGTQVALYFALLWVVALFVSIASIALIIIIIGGFGYIFAGA